MFTQNSADNQQQTSTSKSNQLFKENKETAVTSFTNNKSINEIDIEVLKRKIYGITHYQKLYISKLFYVLLAKKPENAKIYYIYAESYKNTKNEKFHKIYF
jgi:hypothetical protein